MAGFATYIGHNPVDYNVSDEALMNARHNILDLFFRIEYRYKKAELFSPERQDLKIKLSKLRKITIDINKILNERGHKHLTRGVRWKLRIRGVNEQKN